MKYRLAAFDLDNTLLTSEKVISETDLKACEAVISQGGKVILCSGRGRRAMLAAAEQLHVRERGEYFIADNGGTVFRGDDPEPVYENVIPEDKVRWILQEGRKHLDIINIQVYTADAVYVERRTVMTEYYERAVKAPVSLANRLEDVIPMGIAKIVFITGTPEKIDALRAEITPFVPEGLSMFKSTKELLEFVPEETSKGNGVRYVADLYGIPMEEVVAMGDNENDESMIIAAGIGAAPSNAAAHTAGVADYVAGVDNDHGAAAEVLTKFFGPLFK